MSTTASHLDLLCVGHAAYDLIFSVPHHPSADEKLFADALLGCGGGPAANAAVTAARLGFRTGFAGYLGRDLYGEQHCRELLNEGVDINHLIRGDAPTPLSAILVKPDGARALVNYKGATIPLAANSIDVERLSASVLLFDGHEPALSVALVDWAGERGVPTVLDAGSLHAGTEALMNRVDYLVASEKFAAQLLGRNDPPAALTLLGEAAPAAVITLGEAGLLWQRGGERGSLPALPIDAVDTTGAGDVFHGAFAAYLSAGLPWSEILRLSSAAGSFCCTRVGARPGAPTTAELDAFLAGFA